MNTNMYNDIKIRTIQEIENEISDCKAKVIKWFYDNPPCIPMDQETIIANEQAKILEWVLGVR